MILKLLTSTFAVFASSYIVGISVTPWYKALILAIIIGLLNSTIGFILKILTFPITIITFGLSAFAINGLMVYLATKIVPGFAIGDLKTLVIFVFCITLINWFLNKLLKVFG